MTRAQVHLGLRVISRIDVSGVPAGTEGVIDEILSRSVAIAWDLPHRPLPPGYVRHEGTPIVRTGILRDWFADDDLTFLEIQETL